MDHGSTIVMNERFYKRRQKFFCINNFFIKESASMTISMEFMLVIVVNVLSAGIFIGGLAMSTKFRGKYQFLFFR